MPTSSYVTLLAAVRMFRGLSPSALADLAAAAVRVERRREAIFFRQHQEAARFFALLHGRIKITQITPDGHQIVVRYAGPGELFGCVPIFGGDSYPATATAVANCVALHWDRHAILALMERHPRLAINALHLVGEELATLRARYQELATERVEQRVARALLRLVASAGQRVDAGVQVSFPLSRQDLAELTGTTLHTVSRILSGWQEAGIVASGRRRVVVRRPHRLVALADDLGDRPTRPASHP